jgi:hypothetical protein
MAKDKLTDYDSTASGNLDVGGVSVAEGMLPSGVNNAIREQMSHLADFAAGTQPITKLATASIDANGGTIKLDGNYPTGTANVALGNQALDDGSLSGSDDVAIGAYALSANTSGAGNVAVGSLAMITNSTGNYNTAVGSGQDGFVQGALGLNTTGSSNVAVGYQSLRSNTTASNNTAVGYQSLDANTTGGLNTAVGSTALSAVTTGNNNTAVGAFALDASTGSGNTGVGSGTLGSSSNSANNNTAVGFDAMNGTTSGHSNVAIGHVAFDANTTGYQNVAVGRHALGANTTANLNTALGNEALFANTTGELNTAVGAQALDANTTAGNNTAVGYAALSLNTTGAQNTALGRQALYSNTTASNNTAVGYQAGYYVTTGSKNTIVGVYNGNQGGLDIRTSSNNIVLSDGDGNPRFSGDAVGRFYLRHNGAAPSTGTPAALNIRRSDVSRIISTQNGSSDSLQYHHVFLNTSASVVGTIAVNSSSTAYNTSSDYRLKENVIDLTGAADRVQQLAPKRFNFIADTDKTVDGFLAHEVADIVPEAITGEKDGVDEDGNPEYQGIDQSKIVPLLTAALQEALTKIDQLETRIEAMES